MYSQDIVVKQNGLSLLDRPKGSASAKEEAAEAAGDEISGDDLPF